MNIVLVCLFIGLSSKYAFSRVITPLSGDFVVLSGVMNEKSTLKVTSELLRFDNKHDKRPIYLLIDSPGGYVSSAYVIAKVANNLNRPVHTIMIRSFSAGFLLAQLIKGKRLALSRSVGMQHPVKGRCFGKWYEMKKCARRIKAVGDKALRDMAKRSNNTFKALRSLFSIDRFMNSLYMLQNNFIDEIITFKLK